MTPHRTAFGFALSLAVTGMVGSVGGGAHAADHDVLTRSSAPTTLSQRETVHNAPDPASIFEGPKVDDSADLKTGGSFGEPGMRQRAERVPMRAFAEAVRSLRDASVTIGDKKLSTPESARLTDEQFASAQRIQREHQRASMAAMREAGVSMEDLRVMRDENAEPEARRSMQEKVDAATPDPTVVQEKILALLSDEQRAIVEDRVELWRADQYAKRRGAALQKQAQERAAQQAQRRAQNPQELARLARALGISETTAAKVRDALSAPPIPGEEGLSRKELVEQRVDDIPDDLLNARQKETLKRVIAQRMEREGRPANR